jgi:predicted transcriptional regulator
LEAEVLAALGAASGPMTPAEVQSALSGEPAYTTVMTTLSRLHRKGGLTRERSGKAFAYSMAGLPQDVADAVTARRMRRLLDSGEDRVGVLARFVAELDPGDEQVLAQILDQAHAAPEPEPGG